MRIQDTTNILLSNEQPAELLRLADKYMEVYRTDKKRFSLTSEHVFLEPVVKYYATRPKAFAAYILKIRDEHAKGGVTYADLNKLYRTVFTRAVQQDRRARADAAVKKAEKKYGPPPTFSERLAWIARREADWAKQRRAFLDEERTARGGKLRREETTELLKSFWADVDASIDIGVPPWGE